MIKITPDELKLFANYIYNLSGIVLGSDKGYLVETRLDSIVRAEGCTSFSQFYHKVKASPNSRALGEKVVDAITTNETLFFRDMSPFELLKQKILPDLIDKKNKLKAERGIPISIKIWSAACSTGQEIYSVGIIIKELLPDWEKYNVSILGTDISDAAIATASYGQYNKFEIERGMPQDKLQKYFTSDGNRWKISDEIRAMAIFKKLNLMDSFIGLGKFDIVLCRNVAIYFSLEDKVKIFNKIADRLDDGYLIIGSSESLMGVTDKFEPKRYMRSIYYLPKG